MWEREGKLGDEFCAIYERAIRRAEKKKKRNDAQCDSWALNLLLPCVETSRVEEDIYLSRRTDYVTKTFAVQFRHACSGQFAKRVALYASLSIKRDMRIRLSARMPYVPILDELSCSRWKKHLSRAKRMPVDDLSPYTSNS